MSCVGVEQGSVPRPWGLLEMGHGWAVMGCLVMSLPLHVVSSCQGSVGLPRAPDSPLPVGPPPILTLTLALDSKAPSTWAPGPAYSKLWACWGSRLLPGPSHLPLPHTPKGPHQAPPHPDLGLGLGALPYSSGPSTRHTTAFFPLAALSLSSLLKPRSRLRPRTASCTHWTRSPSIWLDVSTRAPRAGWQSTALVPEPSCLCP